MTDIPRGIRNNNPGNIDRTNINWQGMAARQDDPRFIVFAAPQWGLRAIAKIIQAYVVKDSCDTFRKVVTRWAPPEENETDDYVADVAARCGVHPDDSVDVRSLACMSALVKAIVWHENGQQPYTDKQIADGLALAGVRDTGGLSVVPGSTAPSGQ
jgi:hypothetical protein